MFKLVFAVVEIKFAFLHFAYAKAQWSKLLLTIHKHTVFIWTSIGHLQGMCVCIIFVFSISLFCCFLPMPTVCQRMQFQWFIMVVCVNSLASRIALTSRSQPIWSMKAGNGLENRTLENVLEWLYLKCFPNGFPNAFKH